MEKGSVRNMKQPEGQNLTKPGRKSVEARAEKCRSEGQNASKSVIMQFTEQIHSSTSIRLYAVHDAYTALEINRNYVKLNT